MEGDPASPQASQAHYTSPFLTHLVGGKGKTPERQYGILCSIVRDHCIWPGGTPRNWAGNVKLSSPQTPSSNEWLHPEMVCFCDIPLEQLSIHASKYGRFGIAFCKKWLAARGASPVMYVPKGAGCTDHRFGDADPRRQTTMGRFFDAAITDFFPMVAPMIESKRSAGLNLFFWYVLSYLKFYDQDLPDDHPHNYYMEREWRRIGRLSFRRDEVAKIIIPRDYQEAFAKEFPDLSDRMWPEG